MLDNDTRDKIHKSQDLLCSIDDLFQAKVFTDRYHIHLLDFVKKTYYAIYEDGWFTLCDGCNVKWHIEHYKNYTVVKYRHM